jgi:hypothetical protein
LHLSFYAYGSDLSFSGFSRLWSGCGGERGATPLGWQGANIGGRGFWTVGAPRRIRVAVKNGSNTDLIALEDRGSQHANSGNPAIRHCQVRWK